MFHHRQLGGEHGGKAEFFDYADGRRLGAWEGPAVEPTVRNNPVGGEGDRGGGRAGRDASTELACATLVRALVRAQHTHDQFRGITASTKGIPQSKIDGSCSWWRSTTVRLGGYNQGGSVDENWG